MTAAMLVLEPIFEADLPPEMYAYRAGRNAQQAAIEVEELLFRGHPDVVDADLADYFGRIPHSDLLKSVARRIVDRRVLHLIKMWLDCPVEETDERGRTTRTTEARDQRRGIPQGSPLSPLLANSLHAPVCVGVEALGLEQSLGTRLVIYADDLVILCRRGNAEAALYHLREIMGKLKLTVNEDKTDVVGPEGKFDFLGFTFGRMYSRTTGQARLALRPSKKSIKRVVGKGPRATVRARTWQETTELVGMLNRTLRGWANYFSVGTVTPAYRALDNYAAVRLRRWLRFKHKTRRSKGGSYPLPHPLRDLRARASDPAWARRAMGEGVKSCPRAGCREIRMSGSMRGMWKRGYGRATKAPPDERGGNRHARPTATAPHPDSTTRNRPSEWVPSVRFGPLGQVAYISAAT